jgi:GntR family transcriptional regulator
MLIRLNYKSGKAPYLQIVDQVKHAAASGALRPGEFLPGIRPLAESLRINRNTVAKAYAELENQGIVETRAGKGCFISENSTPYKLSVRQEILTEAIDHAIVQAHHLQVDQKQFQALVAERLKTFETKKAQENRNAHE